MSEYSGSDVTLSSTATVPSNVQLHKLDRLSVVVSVSVISSVIWICFGAAQTTTIGILTGLLELLGYLSLQ